MDWNDAEMWLEGAVQNGWSVARMRQQRWEALGGAPEEKPRDEDVLAAELDEDFRSEDDGVTLSDASAAVRPAGEAAALDAGTIEANRELAGAEAVDFVGSDAPDGEGFVDGSLVDGGVATEPVRPFENLPPLPDDLAEAVETLKLAIVQHKLSGWRDVRCDDVLAVLSALKQLALAPAE